MLKRTTHNNLALFIGPAPATGYHWLNNTTQQKVESGSGAGFTNLVFPLLRTQNCNYDISVTRPEATFLGSKSIIVDDITDTTVNVSFDYLQHGIINELRMGFYANYYESGSTVYGHFQRPAISGFLNRNFDNTNIAGTQIANSIQGVSPFDYRDCRNIFILENLVDGEDLIETYSQETSNDNTVRIHGIGNAYISSYNSRASVGDFPTVSVTYTADNIEEYDTPTYQILPAVDASSGNLTSNHFSLPPFSESDENYSYISTVVRPKDISVRIAEVNKITSKTAIMGTGNLSSDYATAMSNAVSSLNVQSYNLSLDFSRTPLNAIGYKRPLDRDIEAPITLNISFDVYDDDNVFHYIQERYNLNKDFYISLTLNNATGDYTDIQYDVLRAKCVSISQSHAISQNSNFTYNFKCDLNPSDMTKGFFISGSKNVYKRNLEF